MKSYLFILPLFLFSFSCTKQKKNESTEPQLPPLTTEGKNVMGCKVNGAIQIYSGKGTLSDANGVYYSNYSSYISLLCSRKEGVNGELVQLIVYKPVSVDNNYAFSSETSEHYAVYSLSTPSLTGDYYTGSGWVKFARLDEHIAAGTFEFTAYRGDDSVVITEGRFDISE